MARSGLMTHEEKLLAQNKTLISVGNALVLFFTALDGVAVFLAVVSAWTHQRHLTVIGWLITSNVLFFAARSLQRQVTVLIARDAVLREYEEHIKPCLSGCRPWLRSPSSVCRSRAIRRGWS